MKRKKSSVIRRPNADGMRLMVWGSYTQTPARADNNGNRMHSMLYRSRHRGRLSAAGALCNSDPLLCAACVAVNRGAGSAPEFPQIIEWLPPRPTLARGETRRPLAHLWMHRDARPGLDGDWFWPAHTCPALMVEGCDKKGAVQGNPSSSTTPIGA